MPGRRYSTEQKEAALRVAAGHTAIEASRQTGISDETISRWVRQADPSALAAYVAEKRAIAARVVLDDTEASARRVMSHVLHIPIETAKDLQAVATSLAIMDDHYGHRTTAQQGTRFGLTGALEQLNPGDRVIAERLVLELAEPSAPAASAPVEPDPQG